jgi:putative aldouronate transport system substrate-binding protein
MEENFMRKLLALLAAGMLLLTAMPFVEVKAAPSVIVFAQVDDGFSEQLKNPEAQQVHQAIIDAINVDVQPLYFPSDQYWNRVNMTIAAGDQLDIISRVSISQAIEFYNDGVIIDLTDLIAEKVPNYLENVANSALTAKARDEMRYQGMDIGFPMISTMARANSVQIRTDWLEKLGMEMPVTIEDFELYMEAVKTQDPDGNGIDDTYGLCGTIWGGNVQGILATAFLPAGNSWWLDAEGVLRHPGMHPNFKILLGKLIEWQEKGYLPPEALLSGDDQRLDWLINNQLGAVAGWYSAPIGGRVTLEEKVPEAWYEPVNLIGLEDAVNAIPNEMAYSHMNVVTSSCKDLDAVARYYNYLYTPEGTVMLSYGIEGLTYVVEDDAPVILKNESEIPLCYGCYVPQMQTDLAPWGFFAGKSRALVLYRTLIQSLTDLPGFDRPDKLVAYDNTAMASYDKQADLDTYYREQLAKVLAGETPLDQWDSIMNTWLEMGGEQYTLDRNEQYQAYLNQ